MYYNVKLGSHIAYNLMFKLIHDINILGSSTQIQPDWISISCGLFLEIQMIITVPPGDKTGKLSTILPGYM